MRYVFVDPDGTWPSWMLVVVMAPTGVVYQQQCAGQVCDQRDMEGFLVPIGGYKLDADEGLIDPDAFTAVFHDGDGCRWGSGYNALPAERLAALRQLVAALPYWSFGSRGETTARGALAIDESRLGDLTEAWVPVVTLDGPGVLIWNNCD